MYFSTIVYLLPFLGVANALATLQSVKNLFNMAGIPKDLSMKFNPTAQLFVTFPQRTGGSIVVAPGMRLPLNAIENPPIWSADRAGSGPFVIAAVDIDAPGPQNRTRGQAPHFLGGDFTPRLRGAGILHSSSPAMIDFISPSSLAGSSAHRFVFLLFNQTPDFNQQNLITKETHISKFNVSDFAAQIGLGDPIAGTFMLVAPDATN